MKTALFILFAGTTLFFSACSKKNNSTTPTTTDTTYINTSAGSTWSYQQVDSSGATPNTSAYTVTSTSKDSTINGRKYHVYNYSYGGNNYLALDGHTYYQYDSIPIPGGVNVERSYLKDNVAVGTTWKDDFNLTIPNIPVPVTLTATNTIAEKGISRTINGVSYSNVIHVSTTLSSALIPSGFTSSIDTYYAPNYGLIESSTMIKLNYLTLSENINIHTSLTGASLK
jgi:hypothetical protein